MESESTDTSDDHASVGNTRPRRRASSPASRGAKRRRRNSSTDQSMSEADGTPVKRQGETAQEVCSRLITAITKHRYAWPFREPVDVEEVTCEYHLFAPMLLRLSFSGVLLNWVIF